MDKPLIIQLFEEMTFESGRKVWTPAPDSDPSTVCYAGKLYQLEGCVAVLFSDEFGGIIDFFEGPEVPEYQRSKETFSRDVKFSLDFWVEGGNITFALSSASESFGFSTNDQLGFLLLEKLFKASKVVTGS